MAQSSDATPFELDDEIEDPSILDNICPECGTESVTTYLDRYSSYEYCTNCDWSDEEAPEGDTREIIGRRDRGQMDG